MKNAIILFGHGSRDPLWHMPMQAVAERIRATSLNQVVECAYLELTQPSLPDLAAKLIANGAMNLRVVPLFLGVGRHAREDLPVIISDLKARYPQITFDVQPAVGENDAVLDLLATVAVQDSGNHQQG